MATEDGRLHPFDESDGSPRTPCARDARREPELLPADWPSPVTWGAPLGAGGEVLGDAPDLVALGDVPGAGAREEAREAGRRRPHPPSSAPLGRWPSPSQSLRLPSLGRVVSAGAVLALTGLAGLVVLVLFSSSGWAPASPGEPVAVVSSPPPHAMVDLADLTGASRTIEARMREAARSRHRAVVLHQRQVIRRQAHARRNAPAPAAGAVTTPVATPAPTSPPSRSTSPAVAPAVRALTPGPWNLS